jgi:hypothetical protein
MARTLPTKTRRGRKSGGAAAIQSKQMQKAMERITIIASQAGRKDEAVQRNARLAIAETIEVWLEWLSEEDPQAVEDFYTELEVLASAAHRRRIAKHALRPEGVDERVERELARIEAEREKEKAEAEKVEREASQPENG